MRQLRDEPLRFHVLSLPWTRTNPEHLTCAYTQKCVKFSEMMTGRGHEVILYSGIENTATCTEHVVAIHPEEQADILGTTDAPWDNTHPAWVVMNIRASYEIAKRARPRDFLCLITSAQKPVADFLPHLTPVEFGIGYGGTFSPYRVFESHAWRHAVYGASHGSDTDGRWYDTVVPNYFNEREFHLGDPLNGGDAYFLFIGRGIERKGPQIAADVCEHLGVRLILAGDDLGGMPSYGERVGAVGPEQRADLMANAVAVFAPTKYLEPFGGVVVEALMSGAPVITTDFGAFTETVQEGDGWRCNTMAEFTDAAVAALEQTAAATSPSQRKDRRRRAIARYGYDPVGAMYETYFGRLMELWGPGWPAMTHP